MQPELWPACLPIWQRHKCMLPVNTKEARKHRPFLGSEMEMSSVTLQKDVSLVSPSPAGVWEEEGLSRSLTTGGRDELIRLSVSQLDRLTCSLSTPENWAYLMLENLWQDLCKEQIRLVWWWSVIKQRLEILHAPNSSLHKLKNYCMMLA